MRLEHLTVPAQRKLSISKSSNPQIQSNTRFRNLANMFEFRHCKFQQKSEYKNAEFQSNKIHHRNHQQNLKEAILMNIWKRGTHRALRLSMKLTGQEE